MHRCGPRYVQNEGVRNGSFEALSHGFGTCYGHRAQHGRLRRMGYPTTTQDSLPAAGQALPDGTGYPRGCCERFPSYVMFLFLLSQASWSKDILLL